MNLLSLAAARFRERPPKLLALTLVLFASVSLPGCARVGAHQQRLVSKPNMTFSDSVVFGYDQKLVPQVEPGSAFSAGAQASGCTSCR
jgi:hypothetical protein